MSIILVSDKTGNPSGQAEKLVNFGKELNSYKNTDLILIVFNCTDAEKLCSDLKSAHVININTEKEQITSQDIIFCLKKVLKNFDFSHLCFDMSVISTEAAGAAAVEFNCSIITGVNKINRENLFTRQIFNSKLESEVSPLKEKTVITVSGSSFKSDQSVSDVKGKTEEIQITLKNTGIQILETSSASQPSSLDNADIILSAGRGFTQKEETEKLFKISELIPSSAVGCSRPLVDMGMLEYKRQVGITGKTVYPKIYAAFGISGSSQHIYGMRDSEFVISVNSDPKASIFNHSDVCIVEDVHNFLEHLGEELENS
ncbi:MAG: electron transfer flavoprotein subunit alpha/FixB family protein [Thermodesulfobacteriota bacterium]